MSELLHGRELFDAVAQQIDQYQTLLNQLDPLTNRLRESSSEAERALGEILARFAPQIKPSEAWMNATLGSLQMRYSTQRSAEAQRVTVQAIVPSVYEEYLSLETFRRRPLARFLPNRDTAQVIYSLALRGQKPIRHRDSREAIQGAESLRVKIRTHILES